MRQAYILSLLLLTACGRVNPPVKVFQPSKLPLDKISLPQGFKIAAFAEGVKNARSLELSPNGTLFVGTRGEGKVYALRDEDGDFRADTVFTIAKGLKMPNGVAFRDGHLYVAEVSRILKFENIEENLGNPPEPIVIFDNYPTETHHGWKFIAFGPDGKLYVPVGAPCNICESEDEIFASITRLNPDGTGMEIVHRGIRNTVGFTWHPETGELWFTDNGRDWLGDDKPACELNHAPQDGMHFGYPYCHEGDLPDSAAGAPAMSLPLRYRNWGLTSRPWDWNSTPASNSRRNTAATCSSPSTAPGTAARRSATGSCRLSWMGTKR